MFASSSTPAIVSLFSSTSTEPCALFAVHTDESLPADSFAHFLDDATSQPPPPAPATLVLPHSLSDSGRGRELTQTVLHLQSPTLRSTYIRCPPDHGGTQNLGLALPWVHLQVRNLGREWSFEVGVVDTAGREGVVRCSTFQKSPVLKRSASRPPLLHLPLSFPTASSTPLTTWATVSLHLPSLLPHFSSSAFENADADHDDANGSQVLPKGRHAYASFVKVYATCRLRRIWFSRNAHTDGVEAPWELQLYAES